MAGAPPPLLLALLGLAVLAAAGGANAAGRKTVGVYELRKGDFSVRVTNWGATLTSVVLPDSKGAPGRLRAHAFLSFHSFQESMASVRPPVLCCDLSLCSGFLPSVLHVLGFNCGSETFAAQP